MFADVLRAFYEVIFSRTFSRRLCLLKFCAHFSSGFSAHVFAEACNVC